MMAESTRAAGFVSKCSPGRYSSHFSAIMDRTTKAMGDLARKYLSRATMGPGWCLLNTTCPSTASELAHVLLDYLAQDKKTQMHVTGPAPPQTASQQLIYGHMTAADFRTTLKDSLKNGAERNTMYAAFGLASPPVVKELQQLRTASSCATTEQHWSWLAVHCPLLVEILKVTNSCVSITTVHSEQAFSTIRYLSEPTSTDITRRHAIQQYQTVRVTVMESV
jgi:hypothetical protein